MKCVNVYIGIIKIVLLCDILFLYGVVAMVTILQVLSWLPWRPSLCWLLRRPSLLLWSPPLSFQEVLLAAQIYLTSCAQPSAPTFSFCSWYFTTQVMLQRFQFASRQLGSNISTTLCVWMYEHKWWNDVFGWMIKHKLRQNANLSVGHGTVVACF